MHFVYIIQSISTNRFYIGETKNLSDRLQRHNQNRSKATKNRGPWKVVIVCAMKNKSEAVKLERRLKALKNSRKAIEYLLKHCESIEHSDF